MYLQKRGVSLSQERERLKSIQDHVRMPCQVPEAMRREEQNFAPLELSRIVGQL